MLVRHPQRVGARKVPQRVSCSSCGTVLYEGFEILRPIEVMQRYNGLCPQCQKRLDFDLSRIRITAVEERKPVEAVT